MYRTALPEILNGLRYFGLGAKVTRSIYKFPDTYWVITRSDIFADQKHGKIYGRLIWRGIAQKETRIHPAAKRDWSLVSVPNYSSFVGKPEEIENLVPKNTERTC